MSFYDIENQIEPRIEVCPPMIGEVTGEQSCLLTLLVLEDTDRTDLALPSVQDEVRNEPRHVAHDVHELLVDPPSELVCRTGVRVVAPCRRVRFLAFLPLPRRDAVAPLKPYPKGEGVWGPCLYRDAWFPNGCTSATESRLNVLGRPDDRMTSLNSSSVTSLR